MTSSAAVPPPLRHPKAHPARRLRAFRLGLIDADPAQPPALVASMDQRVRLVRIMPVPPPVEDLENMRLHAVIVDLALVGPRAWDFLAGVRERLPELGVIVHTAHSTAAQRVCGLRLGADDWVTKPCDPKELLARAESSIRRLAYRGGPRRDSTRKGHQLPPLGGLEVRSEQFQAFVGRRSVGLTPHEFGVLYVLAERRGQIMGREEIYELVWEHAMPRGDRAVDSLVRKIRSKLRNARPDWRYIHTHQRVGYRFEPQPVSDQLTARDSPASP